MIGLFFFDITCIILQLQFYQFQFPIDSFDIIILSLQ